MSPQVPRQRDMLVLWLMVVMIVSGCSGRRITTVVGDQTFSPGSLPAAASEAEKDALPPAAMAKPPGVEAPTSETPPTKSLREEVREEEVHVPEQLTTEAPPHTVLPIPSHPAAELSDIFFDFDQYAIRVDAQSALERNSDLLNSQPNQKIVIEGHCDERGTSDYNLVLGERRAQAAKRYLQDLGLALSQIEITSYGKERPFCTEHSEACWQSNRRAHFRQP
ncbi:MAG: peptidoglycan-associated lipoprotein Pal [Nitrospira sp.]|nr:peptidoglycan-associated lipoprotein Pal [Nitrospira sp.]